MQNNFNYVPKNQFSSYFNNQSYNPAQGVGTSTNNIVWVQGIEGAKAWQLNPNSMVILLDSEADGKMYIIDVDYELAEAEQIQIKLKGMDYSVLDIMLEQEDIKKRYEKKMKGIKIC